MNRRPGRGLRDLRRNGCVTEEVERKDVSPKFERGAKSNGGIPHVRRLRGYGGRGASRIHTVIRSSGASDDNRQCAGADQRLNVQYHCSFPSAADPAPQSYPEARRTTSSVDSLPTAVRAVPTLTLWDYLERQCYRIGILRQSDALDGLRAVEREGTTPRAGPLAPSRGRGGNSRRQLPVIVLLPRSRSA